MASGSPSGDRRPTRRFSSRVRDYVRARPGYPEAVVRALRDEAGLTPEAVVADVGSGTGLSSELFLDYGCTVYAVEPNGEMRRAAEARLGGRPRFHSVEGSAEATTLRQESVDLVAAGQAFHWFDRERARREFVRILRPDGRVALFWNTRRVEATPFLRAYEELLLTYGIDYREVDHRKVDAAAVRTFFGGACARRVFDNEQVFDFEGLKGRLLSSSYAPEPGHPAHAPMLEALRRIFEAHEEDGRVRFLYDVELYVGRLRLP